MKDFHCPACGFRIFNRRYPVCEGCGEELPEELLLSAEDIARRRSDERSMAECRKKVLVQSIDGEVPHSTLGSVLQAISGFI